MMRKAENFQFFLHLVLPQKRIYIIRNKITLKEYKLSQSLMQYKCKECNRAFINKNAFSKHAKAKNHKGFIKFQPPLNAEMKPRSTPAKSQTILTKPNKNIYIFNVADNKPSISSHKCSICGQEFKSFASLMEHLNLDKHTLTPFDCNVCKKHFKTTSDLHQHAHTSQHVDALHRAEALQLTRAIQLAQALKPSRTSKPKRILKRTHALTLFQTPKQFKRAQTLKRKYSCPYCPFTCKTKNSLKYHLRDHKLVDLRDKETQRITIHKNPVKISQMKTKIVSTPRSHEHVFEWVDQGYERCRKCGKTRLEVEKEG